jgi:hypothetical protein
MDISMKTEFSKLTGVKILLDTVFVWPCNIKLVHITYYDLHEEQSFLAS